MRGHGLAAMALVFFAGACADTATEPVPEPSDPALESASSQDNMTADGTLGIRASVQALVPACAGPIFFTPSSVPTAGLVSPAFGPVVHVFTTEYDAFGVHFSAGPPAPNTPTAIFSDPPLAWGGVNAGGIVDLIAPVDGLIVLPATGGAAGQITCMTVEGGFAGVGNLLLEAYDCQGNLIGSTINDDGIGPNGRTLMTLAFPGGPGIAAFRVSTPAPGGFPDTYVVDSIDMFAPTACVIEVVIDIKAGSDPNSINCNNDNGVIPVAILTTAVADGDPLDFDATTVDHTTVTFEGASETHIDKKTGLARRHEEDVDLDGDIDLVFHFRYGDTGLMCSDTEGMLIGETFGGDPIEGVDAVRMVEGGNP